MSDIGPELRDIHLPPDPSWWPPAPGWWLLTLLCIGLIAVAIIFIRRRWARQRWRQRIYNELDKIVSRHSVASDARSLTTDVSQLLRRASRLLDPAAPAMHGEAWLEFLDVNLGTDEFSRGVGRAILEGPYQRAANCDADALLDLTRRWLKCTLERTSPHV